VLKFEDKEDIRQQIGHVELDHIDVIGMEDCSGAVETLRCEEKFWWGPGNVFLGLCWQTVNERVNERVVASAVDSKVMMRVGWPQV
jgi:hypothetical protein